MTSSSSAGPIQISKFPEPWLTLFTIFSIVKNNWHARIHFAPISQLHSGQSHILPVWSGTQLSSVLITMGNTFYQSCFKYKWTIGKKFVSYTLMKFLGTAPMATGRPCGDLTTMFLPYVWNRVHTYFEFFSSFTEGPVFNEHCILIATITVCQFIQNKTFEVFRQWFAPLKRAPISIC